MYDILLFLSQDIDSSECKEWNLLLMEMWLLTFRTSTPKSLVDTMEFSNESNETTKPKQRNSNQLKDLLKLETSQKLHVSNRHSNFGGTFSVQRASGKRTIVSAVPTGSGDIVPQVS